MSDFAKYGAPQPNSKLQVGSWNHSYANEFNTAFDCPKSGPVTLGAAVRYRHISGNNTQNAAIPDKHQIELVAKSPNGIDIDKLQ